MTKGELIGRLIIVRDDVLQNFTKDSMNDPCSM